MFDLTKINKKNICIMGLMGSGKSVIGKDLSNYLNLKFYDTDKEIEIETKKSISAIFNDEESAIYTGDQPIKLFTHHWSSHRNKGFEIYKYYTELLKKVPNNFNFNTLD